MEMDKHLVILDDKMLNENLFFEESSRIQFNKRFRLKQKKKSLLRYHDDGKY